MVAGRPGRLLERPGAGRWMGSVSERCFAFGEGGHIVNHRAHHVCQAASADREIPPRSWIDIAFSCNLHRLE